MVLAFTIPNTNPAPGVSPKHKDGTKIVTVLDARCDTKKSFKVKAEEADAFVMNRNKAMRKNTIAKWILSLASIGALFYTMQKRNPDIGSNLFLSSLLGMFPGILIPDLIMPKSRLGRKETNKFIDWAESKELQHEKN